MILFCADYKIELFQIESEKKDGVPSAKITPLQVISSETTSLVTEKSWNSNSYQSLFFQDILLARYVAYPSLVVSITMTTLHMDWSGRRQRDSKESETLIINVAGRLLILHRSEQVSFNILLYDI